MNNCCRDLGNLIRAKKLITEKCDYVSKFVFDHVFQKKPLSDIYV